MSPNALAKAEEKIDLSSKLASIAQEQLSLDKPDVPGSEQSSVTTMGEPLGSQYSELWQEIARLHATWLEYVELYGVKRSRVELLNDTAPYFFRIVQDHLHEAVMLHIARLMDPPYSNNNKARSNLTLQNLPLLVEDANLKAQVEGLCRKASNEVEFARDWRNRYIAHRDLKLAMSDSATPLPAVELKQINNVLALYEAILNVISLHYQDTESKFGLASRHGGAVELIYLLDDGLKAHKAQQERLLAGEFSVGDLAKDL
jgi:hypothetical protein